jgi:hypothetical protein
MSALGDIMVGLRTIVELTGKVDRLEHNVDRINNAVDAIDRRLVRVETVIEITRSDGSTLRITRDPD